MNRMIVFVAGFLLGAILADISHPSRPQLIYTAPAMTSYSEEDVALARALRRLK